MKVVCARLFVRESNPLARTRGGGGGRCGRALAGDRHGLRRGRRGGGGGRGGGGDLRTASAKEVGKEAAEACERAGGGGVQGEAREWGEMCARFARGWGDICTRFAREGGWRTAAAGRGGLIDPAVVDIVTRHLCARPERSAPARSVSSCRGI